MVNLDAELIGVIAEGLRGGEEIRADVRIREEAQQVLRNGVELSLRQLVIRVRRIGKDIEELVGRIVAEALREALRAEFREVAGTLLERWHGGESRLALAIAETFIEAEDERFILFDRPTGRAAKLVLLQRLLAQGEIIVGIQIVVAQELPQCAMELIRTRAGDDVRGRSQRVAELGIRAVRDDAELADGVDRRLEDESTIDAIDVVRAVDEKVVGFGSLAIDRIGLSIAERSTRFGYPRRQGNDPRLQQAKL